MSHNLRKSRFRPTLERLEDRTFLSADPFAPLFPSFDDASPFEGPLHDAPPRFAY